MDCCERDHRKIAGGLSGLGGMAFFVSVLACSLLTLSGCSSAPKKKQIYSYELPWSGSSIHVESLTPTPPEKFMDGNARLSAYLKDLESNKEKMIQKIRTLSLSGHQTVGDAMAVQPALVRRIDLFLNQSRVTSVENVPGKGILVAQSVYLGADFQSLLGVTLHLVPHKKKKKLGPDNTKPGGGAGGGGGMPMMPMMP
ncbi:MAG: hypothetical protein ACYCXP_07955 [Leptospirillum sp.]